MTDVQKATRKGCDHCLATASTPILLKAMSDTSWSLCSNKVFFTAILINVPKNQYPFPRMVNTKGASLSDFLCELRRS
jgi:hypothetical protein